MLTGGQQKEKEALEASEGVREQCHDMSSKDCDASVLKEYSSVIGTNVTSTQVYIVSKHNAGQLAAEEIIWVGNPQMFQKHETPFL